MKKVLQYLQTQIVSTNQTDFGGRSPLPAWDGTWKSVQAVFLPSGQSAEKGTLEDVIQFELSPETSTIACNF